MVLKDYKERCFDLMKRFDESIANCFQPSKKDTNTEDWQDPFENPQPVLTFMSNPYPNMDSILREFRHLVFAFNPQLPLNKELEDQNALRMTSEYLDKEMSKNDQERIKGYMKFFIKYIEDYCE